MLATRCLGAAQSKTDDAGSSLAEITGCTPSRRVEAWCAVRKVCCTVDAAVSAFPFAHGAKQVEDAFWIMDQGVSDDRGHGRLRHQPHLLYNAS